MTDERQFRACPACWSLELEPAGLREGAVPGAADISGMDACRQCGWSGFPVLVTLKQLEKNRRLKRARSNTNRN